MNYKEFVAHLLQNKEFECEFCKPHTWEILWLRKKLGLTQRQLAKLSGMKQPAISRIESSGTSDFETIGRLAQSMGYMAKLVFEPLDNYRVTRIDTSSKGTIDYLFVNP